MPPASSIIELAYTSTASWLYSAADIADILAVSRANNAKAGITGLLLYKSGSVMQVLEGDAEAVRSLYRKLGRDRRHRDLVLILDRPLIQRNFGEWSMACENLTGTDFTLEGARRLLYDGIEPSVKLHGRTGMLIDQFIHTVR